MIMMPIHNGYSLLRDHGPDCVLLPLVVNLHIAFQIASPTRNANDRTSFSFELLLLQSSRLDTTCVIFSF